jgi:hypothetical protein
LVTSTTFSNRDAVLVLAVADFDGGMARQFDLACAARVLPSTPNGYRRYPPHLLAHGGRARSLTALRAAEGTELLDYVELRQAVGGDASLPRGWRAQQVRVLPGGTKNIPPCPVAVRLGREGAAEQGWFRLTETMRPELSHPTSARCLFARVRLTEHSPSGMIDN